MRPRHGPHVTANGTASCCVTKPALHGLEAASPRLIGHKVKFNTCACAFACCMFVLRVCCACVCIRTRSEYWNLEFNCCSQLNDWEGYH